MQELFQDLPEEAAAEDCAPGARVDVLVPYPVGKAYSYAVPEGMDLAPGDYVTVPLGPRQVPAVVWSGPEKTGAGKAADTKTAKKSRLKEVIARHDMPAMPRAQRDFLTRLAAYTMAPPGAVLKLSLSTVSALAPEKPILLYKLPGDRPADPGVSLSPQRQKVLDVLAEGGGAARRAAEIARQAGCTAGVVRAMAEKGVLEQVETPPDPPCLAPNFGLPGPQLSQAQQAAADHLRQALAEDRKDGEDAEDRKGAGCGGFRPALLDGVTGAGKTEVYFEAVAAALEQGRQVLILLPEIALSNAFLDRFQGRFGCAPALWHSALSPAQRRVTWRGVAQGRSKVVVGARSALFLPFVDLGLIVVDEEHDPAYKQEEGVIYHARDMAVMRAHAGGIPVVLVSATPALETMQNAWAGRYDLLHLPARHGGAALPDIHIVDLKRDKPPAGHFIAPALKDALAQTLDAGEQGLLFLNRRGYAPLTLCRACGYRFECPRCTAWLIEHRRTGRLHCHHCDYFLSLPDKCPSCQEQESFASCGPGVERILEEVSAYFPKARTCVLASDTVGGDEGLRAVLQDIRDHRIDLIIGTQIIAKGHHFPKLTCVGVVDADLGLAGGDLRASERTYQLLHQVAGRAGREADKGHVYLQSFYPQNRVIQALASGARDAFLEVELAERAASHMPPFARLAGVIVSGRDERQVREAAQNLGRCAPHGPGLRTLGPAEASFYRLRGRYRRRLLVCADKKIDIQKTIAHWLAQVKNPSAVRVQIDIDPQSFL